MSTTTIATRTLTEIADSLDVTAAVLSIGTARASEPTMIRQHAAEVRAIADDLLAYQRDHGRKLDAAHIGFIAGRLMALAERLEREDDGWRPSQRAASLAAALDIRCGCGWIVPSRRGQVECPRCGTAYRVRLEERAANDTGAGG